MILLDTNILIRSVNPFDASFATVDAAIVQLRTSGESLCIVPQTIYEFWATATRPTTANGLGYSIAEADACVERLLRQFRFLCDKPNLYDEWHVLVVAHQCHGRVSFDARLVAAMATHGINRIMSLNPGDFTRFPGIAVIDPNSFAVSSPP